MPTRFPTTKQLYGLRTHRTWTDHMGSSDYDVFQGKVKIGEVHSGGSEGWTWTDHTGERHYGWSAGRDRMDDVISDVYDAWRAAREG